MVTVCIVHSTGVSVVELDVDIMSRQALNGSVVSDGYKIHRTFYWCVRSRAER